jgi:hypothetical protein
MKHAAEQTTQGLRSGTLSRTSDGLRLRMRVRLHRQRLDRELAGAGEIGAEPDRTLRATQLKDVATRRRLACSLRKVVAEAERPHGFVLSAVPVCRESVGPLREGLLGLADALEHSGRVNPCGVARTLVLLTDGAGPLFNATSARSISEMVWWIADGLQPCPPHDWGCPKVMKTDPEQVAWTCRSCGAIGRTSDPAVRPG